MRVEVLHRIGVPSSPKALWYVPVARIWLRRRDEDPQQLSDDRVTAGKQQATFSSKES